MGKGGFSCVMCKNISGRNAGIKFFRFPKNPEMSRLWVKACNRIIDRTPEELYKNYRVCSAHFNENMYLNDLKTRLKLYLLYRLLQMRQIQIVILTLFHKQRIQDLNWIFIKNQR